MDFEKYFEQLENTLQKNLENSIRQDMQMFCPYCGEEILSGSIFCPYCGEDLVVEKTTEEKLTSKKVEQPKSNYRPLYKLPFFDGLEEETKTKIRTFEHVYQKAYEEETKRPLVSTFGMKTSVEDFSPLIMSLSSALEIELDKSVLSLMRKIYGKDYVFEEQELKVELCKQGTLRGYQYCIFHDLKKKKELQKHGLDNGWECAKALNGIIQKRNKSGHKGVIGQSSFYDFYDAIYDFFNQYMGDLIEVKNNCKKKAIGSLFSTFSLSDETKITSEVEQKKEFVPIYKKGIILTDTLKLAHKLFDSETFTYNGILLPTQQIVENILKEYIQLMSEVGIVYDLLDVCHYTDVESGKWQSYARCLNNYRDKNYPQCYKEKMGLFIIGGNDVVPMPQIVNPFFMEEGLDENSSRAMADASEKRELLSDRTLDTDMLYAYSNQYSCLLNCKQEVDYDILLKCEPLFWVGRLPLEEGVVSPLNPNKSSFEEFVSYFNRSYTNYVENLLDTGSLGINIKKHVTTTCESTQIAVERMLEGIPFEEDVHHGYIQEKKYVSPKLNLLVPDIQWGSYMNAIKEADMLTFFLHGSNLPSNYCYYGQSKEMDEGYIAFNPSLLLSSNVKVISGVCCWGARFIGYPKVQSALLTAMYSSTLLFVGSSRTAVGVFDNALYNVPNMDIAFSELLLKYYLNYLLQGYDAGEALGRAKMDYIRTEKFSRLDALATMLEFNLFGDPLLSVQPVLERKPVVVESDWTVSSVSCGLFRSYQQVYDSQKKESHSILDRVRGLVDQRLLEVRKKVTELLYRDYNINPQSLSAIHSFQSQGGEQGYRFCFHEKNEYYNNNRIVDTDKNGNITCVIGFF